MKVRKNPKLVRFLFFILFFIGSQVFGAHPFYVSICEIDYKIKTKSLEISLRIFTDDLENTLQDWGANKLYLGEKNETPNADTLLKSYVLQMLSIEVNQKKLMLEFLGKEVEEELTWIYLEANNISDFDKITISNRLLFQSFPSQTNLIHVNHRQQTKSLLYVLALHLMIRTVIAQIPHLLPMPALK